MGITRHFLNDKAKKLITAYARTQYTQVKVEPGVCRFNFRCFSNAVHDAIIDNQPELAMMVYIDGDCPIIHFVNIHEGGTYCDNTLGVWATQMEFHLVRNITQAEYWRIEAIFSSYRKELRRVLPWWVRLFSNFNA